MFYLEFYSFKKRRGMVISLGINDKGYGIMKNSFQIELLGLKEKRGGYG